MKVHLHVISAACSHITFLVHKTSDDSLVTKWTTTREELEAEAENINRSEAQIKALVLSRILEHKGKAKKVLVDALEAEVFNV